MDLLRTIRSQDIYGHLISLNFNKKGSSNKTYLGGIFTIMGKLLILTYALHLLGKMVTFSNDST